MAHEQVNTERNAWADELDQPFDAERLYEIKVRYDRARLQDVVYTDLCNRVCSEWLAGRARTRSHQVKRIWRRCRMPNAKAL